MGFRVCLNRAVVGWSSTTYACVQQIGGCECGVGGVRGVGVDASRMRRHWEVYVAGCRKRRSMVVVLPTNPPRRRPFAGRRYLADKCT